MSGYYTRRNPTHHTLPSPLNQFPFGTTEYFATFELRFSNFEDTHFLSIPCATDPTCWVDERCSGALSHTRTRYWLGSVSVGGVRWMGIRSLHQRDLWITLVIVLPYLRILIHPVVMLLFVRVCSVSLAEKVAKVSVKCEREWGQDKRWQPWWKCHAHALPQSQSDLF